MDTATLTGRHVGRIGALAVALGVGLAVSANTAVAEADTGSAKSPTTSSSDAGVSNRGVGKARSGVRPPKPVSRSSAQRAGSAAPAKSVAVNKLAGTARTPLIGAAPTAPAPKSVLWGVVGWLRREYEYGVLGRRPVIMPSQLVATSTGPRVVQGTMNASGPNANLSYEVTEQPLGGIVTVDAFGQWTYTPVDGFPSDGGVDGFPSDGGVDEFTVKVTDKAFHLAHLFGARAYTSTVTVPVSVPERVVAPNGAVVFTVSNFTKYALTVHYPSRLPAGVGYPVEGTVFQPGQVAEFQVPDPSHVYAVGMQANFVAPTFQSYSIIMSAFVEGPSVYPQMVCENNHGAGPCNEGEITQVVLLDRPGTSVTIPATNAGAVNTILNNVCTLDGASCTYKATNRAYVYDSPHTPSDYMPVTNDTPHDLTTTINWSDTLAPQTSWSVDATASAKLFDMVTAEIFSTYGQVVTDSHTFSQDVTATIPSGYKALLTVEDPVYRYTGDFTVHIGNTTWNLSGATLDVADILGTAKANVTTVPKSSVAVDAN